MTKRLPLFGGLTVLALTIALTGCDPNKNTASNTPPSSGNPAPGTASPANPAPTANSAEAFNTPRKASGPVLIKIITNGSDPFWDSMGIGLKDGLKTIEADPTSNWLPPQGTDNNSQKTVFEQQLAANADGIGVSPIQADAFSPVIDAAIDKGIPVITFDSDAPKSKRLAYIGTNNYEAGKVAGEEVVKLFPNGGNFVAFVGNMSADNAKQRYQGFVDATRDHKIVMLQEPFEDDKDQVGRAHRNVADSITKYADKINGFLGLYAYNGPAIVDEVQKAGIRSKVKIVCFDGVQRTLDNLSKGLVDIAVVQKPYEFGRVSALLLYGINRTGFDAAMKDLQPKLEAEGMKVDMDKHIIDTGVTVVTPKNAVEFIKALHAKGLKST
ncbi:MAG: monosaccharide transporter substrate-binding protein family [Chthonomonadaceae bacterium]|nr:monosaccharide transporter substrate-binding protein family [Chthonomonadaceae bacterium]